MKRRVFFKNCTTLAAGMAMSGYAGAPSRASQTPEAAAMDNAIVVDPTPRFDISPYFYMQFMEPLGITDGSVEAAWSYDTDDWRKEFVDTTRELAPDVIRYGGLFSRYYRWREGVGPPDSRPWMRNYVWGGKETNRVGTHEFVDFCRRVGAEPLYCVNFLGDGHTRYAKTREGNRHGDAREAADWVSYANDPDHPDRRRHGRGQPYEIKLWQIGNETSYGPEGFTKDQCIARTIEFAIAMRSRDRDLKLIGWGDDGWAGEMVQRAGEHLDYIAVHMMQQTPLHPDSVLNNLQYQRDPQRAWEELMALIPARIEDKLLKLEAELDARGGTLPIAITEGHLSLPPRNINPILTEWLTGVYHARTLNLYQRHGDRLKMCTAADFNGTRWTTNAVMMGVPQGPCYLLPAGAVMRLFKRYNGKHGIAVKRCPPALDIAASRSGNTVYLHVANMDYAHSTAASFDIAGMNLRRARVIDIAPDDPRQAITSRNPEAFNPQTHTLTQGQTGWRFPPRSVSVVELDCVASA